MDTKSVMWVIIGLILIFAGIVSSLRENRDHPANSAKPIVLESPQPAPAVKKDIDTGFTIDPIRGLRRKDANEKYFG